MEDKSGLIHSPESPTPVVGDRRRFERRIWIVVGVLLALLSVGVGYLGWSRINLAQVSTVDESFSEDADNSGVSSSTGPAVAVDTCREAVETALSQPSETVDMEALTWSLDACPTLEDWDRAAAETSSELSTNPVSAIGYCQDFPFIQKALLCQFAIRTGLMNPAPPTSVPGQEENTALKVQIVVARDVLSLPGNELVILCFPPGEIGREQSGIPFTYRVSGPIPAPVTGTATSGDSGAVRVPGWTPGMTIRVEITPVEDPSQVYSITHTYVETS